MWNFLAKVYDGEDGGCGLLIAFLALIAGITYSSVSIVAILAKRKKG